MERNIQNEFFHKFEIEREKESHFIGERIKFIEDGYIESTGIISGISPYFCTVEKKLRNGNKGKKISVLWCDLLKWRMYDSKGSII